MINMVKYSITALGRIGSVTEIYLSVSVNQPHYEFTNKTISSVLSVWMCIITACLIGLPAIIPIMFASTFKTNVIISDCCIYTFNTF
jgi:hypothetical protein